MKLKHINYGNKCPICKKFGLKPMHTSEQWAGCGEWWKREGEGHIKNCELIRSVFNFYRCRNCFGEFKNIIKGVLK